MFASLVRPIAVLACVYLRSEKAGLTSVEVMDRTRSWSSTSCLNVGLWDGTACQHSRMIMYLANGCGVR